MSQSYIPSYIYTVEAHYMDLCSHTKYVQRILNSLIHNVQIPRETQVKLHIFRQ